MSKLISANCAKVLFKDMWAAYNKQNNYPRKDCGKEFNDWFNSHYHQWYLRPLLPLLRKVAASGWDAAAIHCIVERYGKSILED